MKKSIQFELWHECNNLCKMCFLGIENRKTPDTTKLLSLKNAIETAKTFNGDIISIIGGEFFQGQLNTKEIKNKFYEFISIVVNRLNKGEIQEAWVTATLTSKLPPDLIEFLDFLNENWVKGKIFICTSYDTIGRFHIEQLRLNWEENMKFIHKYSPNIKLNTTFILTNDLIEKFIANEISFQDFSTQYNTGTSIKHPNSGPYETLPEMEAALPGFLPERQKALRFFKKLKVKEYDVFLNHLFNVDLRSDECVKRDNDGHSYVDVRDKIGTDEYQLAYDIGTNPCGHSKLYQCYKDSDACMKCDYLEIKNR